MKLEATVVLEIGTSMVRVLVGELRDDGIVTVVGIGETESRGIRKGEITNRELAIASVRTAIKAAEGDWRKEIHSVILVTSGGQAESKTSTGIHKLVDLEYNQPSDITKGDVAEIIENARRVVLPETRIKLHSLQQYFQVDDQFDVISPAGMAGEELRLDMLTIHGKRSTVDNFRKMVDDIPIECVDAAFGGLCSAISVVSEEQKNSGVLVIDLGGGTTDFLLYNDGFVHAAGSIAVGAEHVTNDIAVGLQIPTKQAEEIKCDKGNALISPMDRENNISIPATHGFSGKMVRSITLNTIINARIEETFTLVKEQIDQQCPNISLSGGVLLTGGGSFLNGVRDIGQKVFNSSCVSGKPIDVQGLPSAKQSPLYAAHIGGIRYAASLQKTVENPTVKQKLMKMFWGGSHE